MGKKGGLVTLLKRDIPELHPVHCHAHRLELAFRDVVKADHMYDKLSTLLLGLYYFYKRSPKQRKCLKTTFQASCSPNVWFILYGIVNCAKLKMY